MLEGLVGIIFFVLPIVIFALLATTVIVTISVATLGQELVGYSKTITTGTAKPALKEETQFKSSKIIMLEEEHQAVHEDKPKVALHN